MDHEKLKRWFNQEKRDLPWRVDRSPYAVWVSEVMLQQTQVQTVIPYFEKWMEKYPSIADLATASIDDVTKTWEGLGYYSRARNLHEGAKFVLKNFGGTLPRSAVDLEKIKGLGPYTVAAIRSFAFHERAAPVDGNVIRVLCRFYNIEEDVTVSTTVKNLRILADEILPENELWVHSEALIELGAKICKKVPKCLECPLKLECKARACGNAENLPYKSKKIEYQKLFRDVALITCKGDLIVKKEMKEGLMQGLHEFPYFERASFDTDLEKVVGEMGRDFGITLKFKKLLSEKNMSFTKFRVRLRPIHMDAESVPVHFSLVPISSIKKLAFSSGHKRILEEFLN